jgi:hypothetical protein
MVQAHLGANVILAQIRDSHDRYCLTPSDFIKLKVSGVPDAVISAMRSKTISTSGAPVANATSMKRTGTANTQSSRHQPVTWNVGDQTVDGDTMWAARATIPVTYNGHAGNAEVVASCPASRPGQAESLWFRV